MRPFHAIFGRMNKTESFILAVITNGHLSAALDKKRKKRYNSYV